MHARTNTHTHTLSLYPRYHHHHPSLTPTTLPPPPPHPHTTITQSQALRPFSRLPRSSLEALRYRAEDVGRTITRGAIKEARARELQRELLNSDKLTEYFEEHEAERVREV